MANDPRMLKPTSKLRFKGTGIRHFLELYEIEADQRKVSDKDRVLDMPLFVKTKFIDRVRKLKAYKEAQAGNDVVEGTSVWTHLKEAMLGIFLDEELAKYTISDLERFVKNIKAKGSPKSLVPLSKYYYKFTDMSTYLRERDILGYQEETRLFLEGLHSSLREVIVARNSVKAMMRNGPKVMNTTGHPTIKQVHEILSDLREYFSDVDMYTTRYTKRDKKTKSKKHRHVVEESSSSESDDSDTEEGSSTNSESDTESETASSDDDWSAKVKNKKKKKALKEKAKLKAKAKAKVASKSHKKDKKARDSVESDTSDTETESSGLTRAANLRAKNLVRHGHLEGTKRASIEDLVKGFNEMKISMARLEGRHNISSYNNVGGYQNRNNGPPRQDSNNNNYPSGQNQSGGTGHTNQGYANLPRLEPGQCSWCGEFGHKRAEDPDFRSALANDIVKFDAQGKVVYKDGSWIPLSIGQGHQKGWVANRIKREEQQGGNNGGRPGPSVRFQANTSSIEYIAPRIVEIDSEFEVDMIEATDITNEVNGIKRSNRHDNNSESTTDTKPPAKRQDTGDRNPPVPEGIPRRVKTEPVPQMMNAPRAEVRSREPPAIRSFPGKVIPAKTDEDVLMKDVENDKKRAPRARYVTPIQVDSDARVLYERMMAQNVSVPMRELIGQAPTVLNCLLDDCRKRRIPLTEHEINSIDVGNDRITYTVANATHEILDETIKPLSRPSYHGALAWLDGKIMDHAARMLLDSGSNINIMNVAVQETLGLPLRVDGIHRSKVANGELVTFSGLCENVPLEVGGMTVYTHFFVSESTSNNVILGYPFMRQVQATFRYNNDGSVQFGMYHEGRVVQAKVTPETRQTTDMPGHSDGQEQDDLIEMTRQPLKEGRRRL